MCVAKEMETDGELNASKVLSDLSSLCPLWHVGGMGGKEQIGNDLQGNRECFCTACKQIFLSWRRLVLVREKLKRVTGIKGENAAYNENRS